MKDSPLIYFAYADFEEERMKFDSVKAIYEKLVTIDYIDPTLVLILNLNIFILSDLYPNDEICSQNRRSKSCPSNI